MVCFNLWFNEKPWEIEEWDFFLNDLRRHLTKKGKILMSLNKNSNDQFYSQELKKYFVKTGAVINENYIYFSR